MLELYESFVLDFIKNCTRVFFTQKVLDFSKRIEQKVVDFVKRKGVRFCLEERCLIFEEKVLDF